eukprot:CAMPEP_0119344274 /NCGR_PEP_ID=MMETSP1333-20130426/106888_1 /TAXON_ID=418940 /ORGANISM="Scyphosphaera apsteinii, Strain RCC1455" /LENGTH=841 /DNA_ID=CAMNT_0007356709 /DNA_START=446 /DNA_END=2971 /DNA_ORIENTATION=+
MAQNMSKLGYISGTTGAVPIPASNVTNRTISTRACRPPFDRMKAWCDVTLSIDERVESLIDAISLDEIPPLLTAREGGGGSPGPSGAIPRLNLPEYDWGVNCIHGVQTNCIHNSSGAVSCPTSFPNPNALGAGFNSSMWHEMGRIIGWELRSLWLHGATEAGTWSGRPHAGLDCWSPNINIARDPRWGRNQEVPSEDPTLNGVFGAMYTQGLQRNMGVDPKRLQAVVTLKHWDAYTLEDADGFTRHNFDAQVDAYTLSDTYLPAWHTSVVEGGARGVMCSYNALNGVPACANKMLDQILRSKWNFSGYVTSDTGAVSDIYMKHKYRADGIGATCAALDDGGCDINSGPVYHSYLVPAVAGAKACMSNETLRRALRRTLKLRFELGLFDPVDASSNPLWHVSADEVGSASSHATSMLAALEGLVLLKNDPLGYPALQHASPGSASYISSTLPPFGRSMKVNRKPLPLVQNETRSLLVVGPHANAKGALVGNYLGVLCPEGFGKFDCVVSPAAALARYAANVTVVEGSGITSAIAGGIEAAVAASSEPSVDAVVLMLGIDESIEAESRDRSSIDLPAPQHDLATAVAAAAAKRGVPVVLVLLNGGMVAIAEEKANSNIGAILEAFYPGFFGGTAIARTLFGDNDHLGGKLPWTIYASNFVDSVNMSDMSMVPSLESHFAGRTYKYYRGEPTYSSFFGLSLTSFTLTQRVALADPIRAALGDVISFAIDVTNTGGTTGDEVVMAFFAPPKSAASLAGFSNASHLMRQLWSFQRVHLVPGAVATVHFSLDISATLRLVSDSGDYASVPGDWTVTFSNGNDQAVAKVVHVAGSAPTIVEAFPGAEL